MINKMLRLAIIVAAVTTILAAFTACNGVNLSAKYSELLDQTAALSAETASRAQAGKLTPEQQSQALVAQSKTWQLFRDARDGKDSAPATQP
jgi:hypothetical protein